MQLAQLEEIKDLMGRWYTDRRLDGLAEFVCKKPWASQCSDLEVGRIIRYLQTHQLTKVARKARPMTPKQEEEAYRSKRQAEIAEQAKTFDPLESMRSQRK